jgi:DNA repair protein RadC
MAHNHPSGDVTPSKSDIDYTKKIGQAAAIFGIKLLDSIIVSADGKSNSIRKNIANNN